MRETDSELEHGLKEHWIAVSDLMSGLMLFSC
jgi:hypothetical protein